MNKQKFLSAAVLSACLAAAGTAFAQTGPQLGGPQAGGPGSRGGTRPEAHGHFDGQGRHFLKPTEEVEARLAYLKTALKITPAQESAWEAYANLSRQNARDMEARFKTMRAERERQHGADAQRGGEERHNAVARLERQQAFLNEAALRVAKLLEVEKPLYASFSPEQKRVADMVLNPRHMRGHGPMRMGRAFGTGGGWRHQA
ncbi:MAG TPA: Spy/CpxP family protein refolding chaperone [Burkholderiales bacterium]|nr:Spy/CpxP family protein refolding chaperone [Burkholderiales bacterium]